MASMREIKRRRSSISSTQQITKAMKLVSTVKLQKARAQAEEIKPYYETLYETLGSVLARTANLRHPYLEAQSGGKKAVVLITSNRGLAGGYNLNAAKLLDTEELSPERACVWAIGKKGRDAALRRGYEILKDDSGAMEKPSYGDAARAARALLTLYGQGRISGICLAFTRFKNTVVHEPVLMQLLPVRAERIEEERTLMNYEPSPEAVLDRVIPQYIAGVLFGALCEASASENGARMQAMDAATGNAQEMMDRLLLQYNRARQGSITQELTEIIAGADALGS